MDAPCQAWEAAALAGVGQLVAAADAQAEPFFQALAAFLRSCGPGRPVLLSRIASCGPVQAAWSALQRSGYVSRSLKMKQLILRRPGVFRVITGYGNQPHVLLAAPAPAALAAPLAVGAVREGAGAGAGACAAAPGAAAALRPEQAAAVEAHLRGQGGAELLSRLGPLFGVERAQLAAHFAVSRCGDADCVVALRLPGEPTGPAAGSAAPAALATAGRVHTLDCLLARLVPSKHSVCDAMVFCLDNADYAAPLARRLVGSVGEKGLGTEAALARLYVISDVLSNCTGGGAERPGAQQFLASFENLLPEAFDAAGREWFRRIADRTESSRAEQRVRCVLMAWQRAAVFPPLFARGLEALLFAPVMESASSIPDAGADELLRSKLSRWFSVADQARLPYACRLRGLSSKALPTAACRARLCHFERYWHIPGVSLPEDPDLFGDAGGAAPAAPAAPDADGADSCDGEPLSEAELAELGLEP